MNENDLLEPVRLYQSYLKQAHHENVVKAFDELQNKAKVDEGANKATCKKYYKAKQDIDNISNKLTKLNVLRILLILLLIGGVISVIVGIVLAVQHNNNAWIGIVIGIVLLFTSIFLLAGVINKKIKQAVSARDELEKIKDNLYNEALAQMASLNALFDSSLSAKLFQQTCPLIEMDRIFDVKKYELLHDKFGLWDNSEIDSSTLDLQSGSILGNPFVIFRDLNMVMVNKKYYGSTTITYTTGYGKDRHTVTETLRATYEAPAPVYAKNTYLVYANEGAQKLSFSREPSNINSMNEDEIKKYVRKHEKDLDKIAAKQMKKGGNYTPIGNPEFDLFFGGFDRDNEVEFRLLFTALGQKSMMDLLKSKVGYGDDFSFKKMKGINLIQSDHSQGCALFANTEYFKGIDFEEVKNNFIAYNDNYFKSIFFDFAPILSIPLYSQYKTHDYIYKGTVKSNYAPFEHEVCSNRFDPHVFAHKASKTDSILKTTFVKKDGATDVVNVTAHSFDAISKIAPVSVMGGDGRSHIVNVPYFEYNPLKQTTTIQVSDTESNDEVKFNSLSNKDVIYAKGLVSNIGDKLNVDIKQLKALMKKD